MAIHEQAYQVWQGAERPRLSRILMIAFQNMRVVISNVLPAGLKLLVSLFCAVWAVALIVCISEENNVSTFGSLVFVSMPTFICQGI